MCTNILLFTLRLCSYGRATTSNDVEDITSVFTSFSENNIQNDSQSLILVQTTLAPSTPNNIYVPPHCVLMVVSLPPTDVEDITSVMTSVGAHNIQHVISSNDNISYYNLTLYEEETKCAQRCQMLGTGYF